MSRAPDPTPEERWEMFRLAIPSRYCPGHPVTREIVFQAEELAQMRDAFLVEIRAAERAAAQRERKRTLEENR